MSDNLKIWDGCKHIEEKHLKAAKVAGNQCITVNGLEMVRIFTASFGPIGKNWRYEIVDDRMDEVKPMKGMDLMELSHTIKMRFWIKHDDEWSSFEQYGHTKVRYAANSGYVVFDEEYAKKSTTDALKKCLSLLGVAADVYTGDLDNLDYRAEVMDKQAVERFDKADENKIEAIEEVKKMMEASLVMINSAPDIAMARKSIKNNVMKISNRTTSSITGKAANHALNIIESKIKEKFEESGNV